MLVPLSEAGASLPAGLSGIVVTVAGLLIVIAWLASLYR